MFEAALNEAKALDEEFTATGHIRGPLHGVPISLKDLCTFSWACLFVRLSDFLIAFDVIDEVKGVDATIGFTT